LLSFEMVTPHKSIQAFVDLIAMNVTLCAHIGFTTDHKIFYDPPTEVTSAK